MTTRTRTRNPKPKHNFLSRRKYQTVEIIEMEEAEPISRHLIFSLPRLGVCASYGSPFVLSSVLWCTSKQPGRQPCITFHRISFLVFVTAVGNGAPINECASGGSVDCDNFELCLTSNYLPLTLSISAAN